MLLGNLIGILIIVLISITYFLPDFFTFMANLLVIGFFIVIYFLIPDFLNETAEGGLFIYLASVLTLAIPFYQIQNYPLKDHTVSQNELTSSLMGSLAIIVVLYILELRAFSKNQNKGGLGINKIFFMGALYNWLNYTRLFILNSIFYKNGLKPVDDNQNSTLTNYLKNEENISYVDKSKIKVKN